jgi:pimeloyl-ACP methyl ester carboxylesterase
MLYNHHLVALDDEPATPFEMILHSAEVGPPRGDFQPVRVLTSRGTVEARLYGVTRPRRAVVLAGGAGGGWEGPAFALYPRLGNELRRHSIAALRIRYRHPECLEECVLDVLAGVGFLESEGIDSIALVGHDLGGPVVMQAAALTASARTVVTLAAQRDGPDPDELPPDCSLLLIHGLGDEVVSVDSSEDVYECARQPKQLVLYPDAGHRLDEVAAEVYDLVFDWIMERLRNGRPRG